MFTRNNPKLRILYLVWAFLECAGFGGLLYGWGSLVFVLKDEGLYLDLCPEVHPSAVNAQISSTTSTSASDEKGCTEQDSRLNLVFTIGSTMMCIGCLIIGQINFKYGTRVSRLVSAALYIIGAFLLAFTSNDVPWLVFPGLSLIGFGGLPYMMTNTQISNLFPTNGALVVGILAGAFDTSAGIQQLIKLGYENGITRKTSYIIIGSTHFLTLISTFFFLPKDFIHKVTPVVQDQEIEVIEPNSSDKDIESKKTTEPSKKTGSFGDLKKYLLSGTYLLHVFWLSLLQLRFYFVLGSINSALENILDTKEEVSHYTDVFMYVMMGGLLTSPFAGFFYGTQFTVFKKSKSELRRHLMPAVIPLAVTTTLCLIMSALVLIEEPTIMYIVFGLLLVFRSFLYTMAAGYISAVWPSSYMGILYGLMIAVAGIFSLLQNAFFEWSETYGSNQPNIFLLVLTCLTYIHPLYQWYACRRAEKQEEENTQNGLKN